MKSSKLIERMNPLLSDSLGSIQAIDLLSDSGVGQRTRNTLQLVGDALDLAHRLMVTAVDDAEDKEFTP